MKIKKEEKRKLKFFMDKKKLSMKAKSDE